MGVDGILISMSVVCCIIDAKNLMRVKAVVNNDQVLAIKICEYLIAIEDLRE